jgi:hypothetical protein
VTAPKPRLRDVEARAEAMASGGWVDVLDIAASRTDVPALTAAIRAVLARLDPAGTSIRPTLRFDSDDIRAALSAHIDLDES